MGLVYLRILIYLLHQALPQTSIRHLQCGLILKASTQLHLLRMHPAILLGRHSHLSIQQEVKQQRHNALLQSISSNPMLSETRRLKRVILKRQPEALVALGALDLIYGCV